MSESATTTGTTDTFRDVIPYVVPMFGYLALTSAESWLPTAVDGRPSPVWYPWAYTLKVAVTAGLMWTCRTTWRDLAPWPGWKPALLAIVVGLLVCVVWVVLDGHYPTFAPGGAARRSTRMYSRPSRAGRSPPSDCWGSPSWSPSSRSCSGDRS